MKNEAYEIFNKFPLEEKAIIVEKKGKYLLSIKKPGYCIHFYSIDDFYIGALFSTYKEIDQVVLEIIGFKKTFLNKLLKKNSIKALGGKF